MPDNRVTARLGSWTPPQQYNQPHLEPEGGIRTAEHDVLGEQTVVQYLGDKPDTFVLRGDAFAVDISKLREMQGQRVEIRHEVFSGEVLVKGVSSSSTGSWEDVKVEDLRYELDNPNDWNPEERYIDDEEYRERDMSAVTRRWVYNYTVELMEM